MFNLTFLGTSASVPSAIRNHPGLLIEAGASRILVDCGEATQRQLLRAEAGFRRLDTVLLTHAHFDHILGLPGLLSTLRLREAKERMRIFGGTETLQVVARMFAGLWGEERAPVALDLVPISDGRVLEADGFVVDCFRVRHRDTDSLAFSFERPAKRHFSPDKLAALGVPDGPLRKALAEGHAVQLDGRTITPDDILGRPDGGRRLVVVGDVETTDGLDDYARGADALVIEATFLQRDAALARDYGHLTAAEGAALAARAGVKKLLLNHISGRYSDEEILAEARSIFPASEIASDLDCVTV